MCFYNWAQSICCRQSHQVLQMRPCTNLNLSIYIQCVSWTSLRHHTNYSIVAMPKAMHPLDIRDNGWGGLASVLSPGVNITFMLNSSPNVCPVHDFLWQTLKYRWVPEISNNISKYTKSTTGHKASLERVTVHLSGQGHFTKQHSVTAGGAATSQP